MALVESVERMSWQLRTIPDGFSSCGQLPRARNTNWEISMLIGQTCWHLLHWVQHQTQGVVDSSSSIPSIAIRMNFLGSMFSMPEAGQPEEQRPQVKQDSKLAPSGSSSMAFSLKLMVGIFLSDMAVSSFLSLRS